MTADDKTLLNLAGLCTCECHDEGKEILHITACCNYCRICGESVTGSVFYDFSPFAAHIENHRADGVLGDSQCEHEWGVSRTIEIVRPFRGGENLVHVHDCKRCDRQEVVQ
jgi:hypothetical protein